MFCALHIFLTVRRIQVNSRGREVGRRCLPSFLYCLICTNFRGHLISAILQKMINLRHLISLKLTRDRLRKSFFFELLSCHMNLNTLSPVRAIDSFVYMVSCNMIGRAQTKTRKFGRKELGRPIPCARNIHGGHIAT